MDEKVIEVVQTMITLPRGMHDIYKSSEEYYFKYKTHQFSILRRSVTDEQFGPYSFYVYPAWSGSSINLAQEFELGNTEDIHVVVYHSVFFKEEDLKFLVRLYLTVEEQYSNVDFIFDDILAGV